MRRFLPATACLLAVAIGLTNCGRDRGGGTPADLAAGGDAPSTGAPADGGAAHCPPQMALVAAADGGVCVDRYEASTVVRAADGGTSPHPYDQPVDVIGNGLTIVATVAEGAKPQAYISQEQASAACAHAGKRLCRLAEWLAACQGPNGTTYPYGNTYEPGACNEGRATNPVNDCFGSGNVFTYANMNSPCCDDQPNTVAPGGSFPRCVSAWGIYDLHGNVHEWVDATTASGTGVFKGGYFVDATINGHGCLYTTTAHAPTYHDYSTGFRCCAEPR